MLIGNERTENLPSSFIFHALKILMKKMVFQKVTNSFSLLFFDTAGLLSPVVM